MIGDVALTNGFATVVVTAEDQQMEPQAIQEYLADGYEIVKDEREREEEE